MDQKKTVDKKEHTEIWEMSIENFWCYAEQWEIDILVPTITLGRNRLKIMKLGWKATYIKKWRWVDDSVDKVSQMSWKEDKKIAVNGILVFGFVNLNDLAVRAVEMKRC